MANCGAYGCTNRSGGQKNISFHRLPAENRDKWLRRRWLLNIKREGEIPKNLYICSQHFEPECFERDLKVGNKL